MGKILSITYGAAAYLIFIFTLLYAIGFVGNMVVPKTIDSGTETSFVFSIMIDVLLLSVFAIQHSLMARPAFKKWISTLINSTIERSTYVLMSSFTLILVFWQWKPINTIVWNTKNEIAVAVLTGVFFLGWLIFFLSTCMINHFELFGLKQIIDRYKGRKLEDSKFQINFLYKIIRHPIMFGFLIAFWATPSMTVGHLVFSVITTVYILIAVKYLEEKELRELFGKEYKDYEDEVPMIIPFTKNKS